MPSAVTPPPVKPTLTTPDPQLGKVVFLARSLDFGGAERQLVLLASRLHALGYRVQVAVFYGGGGLESDLGQAGVPIHHFTKKGRWDILSFIMDLIRFVRTQRPAVLHGYLTVPNSLSLLLRPFCPGMKVVMGVRASNLDLRRYDHLSRLSFRLECLLSRWADLVIANSRSGRDYHISQGFPASRIQVVANGIDIERFRPDAEARRALRTEWQVPDAEILIGLIGRIDPMKDHPTFLRAAALLAERHADVRFVCMGNGDPAYKQHLMSLADQSGLASRVLWQEACSDVGPVYAALDILTSASGFGEGFSNVIGEAMAAAVPCVVTDVGDSAWIVGDCGRIVPPGDAAAMAAAWEALIALPDTDRQALGQHARRRIKDHFSVEALVQNTVAAIASITPINADAARSAPTPH